MHLLKSWFIFYPQTCQQVKFIKQISDVYGSTMAVVYLPKKIRKMRFGIFFEIFTLNTLIKVGTKIFQFWQINSSVSLLFSYIYMKKICSEKIPLLCAKTWNVWCPMLARCSLEARHLVVEQMLSSLEVQDSILGSLKVRDFATRSITSYWKCLQSRDQI